ncbi:MAG: hypothetical protein M0T74_14400 [Desulfitobacterium hafniense]|nr:hypothetical protein [Desulfitobacterium hafniense]
MFESHYSLDWIKEHLNGEWESPYLTEILVLTFKIAFLLAIGIIVLAKWFLVTSAKALFLRK